MLLLELPPVSTAILAIVVRALSANVALQPRREMFTESIPLAPSAASAG
jgi:hypothetical protein